MTPVPSSPVALLDQLDEPAPDDPELWSAWVTRRSRAIPKLTAAVRAVLELADDWDRNAEIFPEYGDLSAAAARSIRTAIHAALSVTP